jgi:hypothetical protein
VKGWNSLRRDEWRYFSSLERLFFLTPLCFILRPFTMLQTKPPLLQLRIIGQLENWKGLNKNYGRINRYSNKRDNKLPSFPPPTPGLVRLLRLFPTFSNFFQLFVYVIIWVVIVTVTLILKKTEWYYCKDYLFVSKLSADQTNSLQIGKSVISFNAHYH